MSELAFKSAVQLAQLIKDREISALELPEHYLDRIQKYNDAINAIIVHDIERAKTRAKKADEALSRGESWGPLHGVPMTCKESFNVAGLPTTFGVPEFKNNIADTDALAIQRLKSAGAIIFGKTNVPLSLVDFQSYNDIYGTTNNPWNLDRIPGGSSGGSAAADEYYDAIIDVGCLPLLVVDLDRQLYLQNFVDIPQFQNAWEDERPFPIQLPDIATLSRSLVQYRSEIETVDFEFLYDRCSRSDVHVTFEVRIPEEETDRIDFDDDDYYRRKFDDPI